MTCFVRLLILFALAVSGCASVGRENTPYQDRVVERQRRRASLQMEYGNYTAAAATLDSLTRARPADGDLFSLLGDAHRGAGQVDAAIKSYEQAIRINYGVYEPHMKLGTLLMENGKTGRALTEFEVAVKYADHDPLVRYNYGLALYELGRKDEAMAQWKTAAEIDPANVRVAEAMAMGWSGVSDSTAAACFDRARALGADSPSFHNNYGLVLDRLGRRAEAETEFRAAIDDAPADKRNEYRRNLGICYLRASRNEDAAREFGDLVTADGGKWSDTVYLARARLALGEFDAAISALESLALDVESGKIARPSPRIDRMPPGLDEALDILGMAWRGAGKKKKAVEYLRRAVALRPDDPAHLNNYGVALAEGGMLRDARIQWRRVLEIDPGNATARANLSAFGQ
jgi:Flp pilus assembly protein TadD